MVFTRENMRLLVLFFFVALSISNSDATFCEEEYLTEAERHRDTNNGKLSYVTLECQASQASANLSNLYRENIVSITIKNCCKLSLRPLPFEHLPELKLLKIVNISELFIFKNSRHGSPCLAPNVILENIRQINYLEFSYRIQACNSSTVESLFLKNISVNILSKNFTAAFGNNLSHLEMENIQIKTAESDSLILKNAKAIVKISNSIIGIAKAGFLNFNVSEVNFSENIIKDFNETDTIMCLEANKVIFNGNKMKALTKKTLYITSDSVQITENSFHQIDKNAFDNLLPKSGVANSFMNFSSNTFHFVSPKSSEKEDVGNFVFSDLIFENNKLQCESQDRGVEIWYSNEFQNSLRNYFFPLAGKTNSSKTSNFDLNYNIMDHNSYCKNHYCIFEEKSDAFASIDVKDIRHDSNCSDEVIKEIIEASEKIEEKSEASFKLVEENSEAYKLIEEKSADSYNLIDEKSEVFEDYNLDSKGNHRELDRNHYNHTDEAIKEKPGQIQSSSPNDDCISLSKIILGVVITFIIILICVICVVWYKKFEKRLIWI